ncbi:MAG: methylisocitrate lyase [Planctomycetota bacterium]
MTSAVDRGTALKRLVAEKSPVQMAGTPTAYCALLAIEAGFRAIYLSGAAVANSSFGIPDLGRTTRANVVEDARRITDVVDLPLLVDADTGWEEEPGGVAETIRSLSEVNVAGCHLEDQITDKRCGHRAGKHLVDLATACDRIKAAVDARTQNDFVIMARTDAYGVEGFNAAVDRANRYVEAGADMIFAEAMKDLSEYQSFCEQCSVPILANMTEFGVTPLFDLQSLASANVGIVLYPLSAFRAMSKAAESVYRALLQDGTQEAVLPHMQTRDELYGVLDYYAQEQQLDETLSSGKANDN